jgi:PAS domain S-box-containing protein
VRFARAASGRHVSITRRVVTLLAAYAFLTAAVLSVLLLYLRSEAIASGQKVLAGFAELASEQTTRTLQSIDQTLQAAEAIRLAAADSGAARLHQQFNDLLADRPFLTSIAVIDRRGHIVQGLFTADTGRDISDREFFTRQRDEPDSGLLWGTPIKSRSTGAWIVTATLPIHDAAGQFDGLIVGSVPLAYFDTVWRFDDDVSGLAIALWRDDGVLLMRSPIEERAIGLSTMGPSLLVRIRKGEAQGRYDSVSAIDNVWRLVVFRRLSGYPNFILTFTQSASEALTAWWQAVWIVAVGWAIAAAAVTALAIWTAREWAGRHAVESRYRILFDSNPSPMLVTDRDTQRFLAANDAAVAQYGWSREELGTMEIDDLDLPEALPTTASQQEDAAGSGHHTSHLRQRKKDGTIISVERNVRRIDFEGQPALLAIVQDVTLRKAAEQHLAQMEGRYRGLLEAAPDAMVVVNQAGEIVLVNVQAEKQFGYRRDELLGQRVTNIIPEGFAERLVTDATRSEADALAQEIGTGIELSARRKNGDTFPIEIMLSPLASPGGILVTAAIRNISVRRASEEQLRQSQKMEAVGQLTGGIAHDFNNILFVILANTDALLEDESFSPSVADRLGQIDKAVQRAADLTRQLLAFSRKQPLQPQVTDLNDLVTDTGKLLRRSLGTEIEIEAVLADDLCIVNVDRSQFETALVNLALNARDAMPAGGRLLIETRNVTLDEEYCAVNSGAVPGAYAMLAVSDAGQGIPADALSRVFEPFFTTKDVGKGTGLGLSMVYGFIKQSNGHVSIYSEIGVGTSVKLFLPRYDGTVEVPLDGGKTHAPGGSERILVVEDEPQVRANIVRQLNSLGYSVADASDGTAGLAACEAAVPPYDLLLSDVVMPGPVGGKRLGAEVARRWPRTKVVFMSGFPEVSSVRHGRLDEGSTLLSKPFRKSDLARVIRHALDTASAPDDRTVPLEAIDRSAP